MKTLPFSILYLLALFGCKTARESNCIGVNCNIMLEVDRFNRGIHAFQGEIDTLKSSDSKRIIVIKLCSCKGDVRIKEYRISDTSLYLEGWYANGVDSIAYFVANDFAALDEVERRDTVPYIYAFREGIWKYYDEKGRIIKTEKYRNGELIR
jgi:hypothetical protein